MSPSCACDYCVRVFVVLKRLLFHLPFYSLLPRVWRTKIAVDDAARQRAVDNAAGRRAVDNVTGQRAVDGASDQTTSQTTTSQTTQVRCHTGTASIHCRPDNIQSHLFNPFTLSYTANVLPDEELTKSRQRAAGKMPQDTAGNASDDAQDTAGNASNDAA